MKKNVIERIRTRTQPETRIFVRKNLDVAFRVNDLLRQKGWTQKDLAKMMGKTESEVSRWLSGLHNITLKSIVKMEEVLGAEILIVPENEHTASHFGSSPENTLLKTAAHMAVAEPVAKYEKTNVKR